VLYNNGHGVESGSARYEIKVEKEN